MKLHNIVAITVLAFPPSTFARVGETPSELVRRYGQRVGHEAARSNGEPETESFAYQQWGIRVFLVDGRSVYEEFVEFQDPKEARANPDRARVSSEVSQRSVDLILGANSRGKQWQAINSIFWQGRSWQKGTWGPDHVEMLLDAWSLQGEPLFALRKVFIDKQRFVVCSQDWIDYVSRMLAKDREKDVKKSGL